MFILILFFILIILLILIIYDIIDISDNYDIYDIYDINKTEHIILKISPEITKSYVVSIIKILKTSCVETKDYIIILSLSIEQILP